MVHSKCLSVLTIRVTEILMMMIKRKKKKEEEQEGEGKEGEEEEEEERRETGVRSPLAIKLQY